MPALHSKILFTEMIIHTELLETGLSSDPIVLLAVDCPYCQR